MILDSPEHLTSIEISRPVVDGTVKFLDKIRQRGEYIFGETVSTLVEDHAQSESDLKKLIGVGSPRLSLYQPGELKLTLFERRAIASMRLHGSFRNALARFESDADPYYEYAGPIDGTTYSSSPDRSLEATMNRVGYKYGVSDQSAVRLRCDTIAPKSDGVLDPRNGTELTLVPDYETAESAMLVDQAGMCLRGLAYYGRKSVYPMAPTVINIPVGRLPRDVNEQERTDFLSDIKQHLPIVVTLGAITTRVSRQH